MDRHANARAMPCLGSGIWRDAGDGHRRAFSKFASRSGRVRGRREGRITSFSFRSDSSNAGEQLDFLVLRPEGSKYRVVGRTGVVRLAGTGLETVAADIPVAGGDILGFWFPTRLDNCYRPGTGPLFAKITASDPNTGDLIAVQPQGAADLNESANLGLVVGRPPPPTRKNQCKHGGWKSFGTMFKNQGDCVSYLATGGLPPADPVRRHWHRVPACRSVQRAHGQQIVHRP